MKNTENDISRRSLLRWVAAAAASPVVPLSLLATSARHSSAAAILGFQPVTGELPTTALCCPPPPVAPPVGSSPPAFDIFGNFWTLAAPDAQHNRQLLVLPAQSPQHWQPDTLSTLPKAPWQHLGADEFGYVWISTGQATASRILRLDPHTPQSGWTDFTPDLLAALPAPTHTPTITAMGLSANGAITAAVTAAGSGFLVELDRDKQTTVTAQPAPAAVSTLLCDAGGDLWLRCDQKTLRRSAPPDAWQRQWELVDRLPAGDHDLSGDILNQTFYMAGGQNAGWGYPALPHVFRELFAFSATTHRWSIEAQLDQPRFYNGTSFLDGRVWIIAGYTRPTYTTEAAYKPTLLTSVEIWDPATRSLTPGPSLPIPLDNPLALHIDGRIYVAGCQLAPNSSLTSPQRTCLLLSIGAGETSWHREPDGPPYLLALAGTAYGSNLYLALAGRGLGIFNTKTRTWSVVPVAHAARSPQMATYRDEIWIMGGRDIDHQDATTIYTPSTASWRPGPNLPRPLAWGAATTIADRLMVVGGAAGRGYNNRTFLLREKPLTP
jgi:hypothetical protein